MIAYDRPHGVLAVERIAVEISRAKSRCGRYGHCSPLRRPSIFFATCLSTHTASEETLRPPSPPALGGFRLTTVHNLGDGHPGRRGSLSSVCFSGSTENKCGRKWYWYLPTHGSQPQFDRAFHVDAFCSPLYTHYALAATEKVIGARGYIALRARQPAKQAQCGRGGGQVGDRQTTRPQKAHTADRKKTIGTSKELASSKYSIMSSGGGNIIQLEEGWNNVIKKGVSCQNLDFPARRKCVSFICRARTTPTRITP